jgi:hypothetical protein
MSSGALNLTAGPQLIADWSTPVLRRSTFPMGQRQAHPTNPIPIAVSLTSVETDPARRGDNLKAADILTCRFTRSAVARAEACEAGAEKR